MKRCIATTAAALGASAVLLPAIAMAQISDSWQFQGTIYGYLPTMGIKTNLPNGATSDISISPKSIIDHLKFTFMGALEAQKGRWGAFTDIIYMDIGNANVATRDFTLGNRVQLPADVTASTSADLKAVIWTLAGSYRTVADPDWTLDVLAGARLIDLKETQYWQLNGNVGPIPLPGRSGSAEIRGSNWDAVVGVKGRLALDADRKWFIPYYLDVGTGESRLTWQAMGGVGYAYGWGDVIATWRYLAWNNGSGKPLRDLDTNGAMVGVTFHW